MGFFDSSKVTITPNLKNNVLFPGNILEGVITIQCSSEVSFSAIRLKIVGKETVEVEETVQDGEDEEGHMQTHTETHKTSTCVLKQLITLAGNMKCQGNGGVMGFGGTSYDMPAGTYHYPFAFQLPTPLPPSFQERVGSGGKTELHYHIKAYVDLPRARDAATKVPFTVVRPMPARQWLHKMPVSVDRNFEITCCCCIPKGDVRARIHMDRSVIAIDRDQLSIYADIDNSDGSGDVEHIEVSFVRKIETRAEGHTKTVTTVVGKEEINQGVAAGEKGVITGTIPLPRKMTPTLTTFNTTSTYMIKITMSIPWASDPEHSFPVLVAQSVDDTNYSPDIRFQECTFTIVPKDQCPEFYYSPPPNPVYQPQMIPNFGAPPPNAPVYNYAAVQMPALGIPNAAWSQGAAPMMQGGAQAPAQQPMQWQQGYAQPIYHSQQQQPQQGMPQQQQQYGNEPVGAI